MSDEFPEAPTRFVRALEGWDFEEVAIEQAWQALCEEYGDTPLFSGGAFVVEIVVKNFLSDEDEED